MNRAALSWKTRQSDSSGTRPRGVTRFKNVSRRDLLNALSHGSTKSHSNSYERPVKIIRLIIQLFMVIGMLVQIVEVTLEFLSSPTVTTAETNPYPTQKVDFPAIAICSVNRISRTAASDLAAELMDFDSTTLTANVTVEELADMLRLMGNLYMFQLREEDIEKTNLLHTILERGYNGYDTDRIMKRLTPKCRSILRKCAWEGKDQVCDDLFYLRRTDSGFCCVFNYIRQSDSFGNSDNDGFITQETLHSRKIGSEYGLSVLLNPQIDDSAYELLPSHGIKIQVYLPFDYPDASSGGMREVLISPKTETFLDLNAVTFYTDPDVEQYDILKRDCLFSTEQANLFHGHYSFSDCIMHCRIRDIFELCKCVPFFFPASDSKAPSKTCNLRDIPCLKKYKDKWLRLKPRHEDNMVPFSEELFEGKSGYITCDCLPACADTSYRISASSMPLTLSEVAWGRTKHTLTNHSIVHIFFGQSGSIRLRQGVLFYGYELMSYYGGICSFFLGISVISLVEMLYKVMVVICTRNTKAAAKPFELETENKNEDERMVVSSVLNTDKISSPEQTSVLYWNELTGSVSRKDAELTNSFLKRINTH